MTLNPADLGEANNGKHILQFIIVTAPLVSIFNYSAHDDVHPGTEGVYQVFDPQAEQRLGP